MLWFPSSRAWRTIPIALTCFSRRLVIVNSLNSRSPILLMCSITARFTPRLGEGLYSGLLGMPQALPAR